MFQNVLFCFKEFKVHMMAMYVSTMFMHNVHRLCIDKIKIYIEVI
jgi:hypothetical protein